MKKLFGISIKNRRSQLGISQEELAERADLHRTYVCDVERGARNISLQSITKLARALEISVAALFLAIESPNGKAAGSNGSQIVDILLVEDNPDDAQLALSAFQEARFTNRIQVVTTGTDALDYIFCRGKFKSRRAEKHPQMILLDLKLPDLSGLEVLRRLKAVKRTRNIPVVILTISQSSRDIAECRRLGAETYIVKPLDFQRLSQATPHLKLNWTLLKPAETNGGRVRA